MVLKPKPDFQKKKKKSEKAEKMDQDTKNERKPKEMVRENGASLERGTTLITAWPLYI